VLIARLTQQRRYPVHLFAALDSDRLAPHMDIRPIRIARLLHIFRSKRLCNYVFHVRLNESLKLVEGVPARTGHMTIIEARHRVHFIQAVILNRQAKISRASYQ
jgi:hypothetical protein